MLPLDYYCKKCNLTWFESVPECKIAKDHSTCPECGAVTDLVPIKNVVVGADKVIEVDDNVCEE